MLYEPGTHLGGPEDSVASTELCQDTVDIIGDWDPETLTVCRRSSSYDSTGKATVTWPSVDTFIGDWQPASGRTARAEEGLKVKSDAFVITPCNADVQAGDRIYRSDNSFMYINYVRTYKGHQTIFLTKTDVS